MVDVNVLYFTISIAYLHKILSHISILFENLLGIRFFVVGCCLLLTFNDVNESHTLSDIET